MLVPAGARLQFLRPEKRRSKALGTLTGFVVGLGLMGREESPSALMGAIAGAIMGHFVKRSDWGPVR